MALFTSDSRMRDAPARRPSVLSWSNRAVAAAAPSGSSSSGQAQIQERVSRGAGACDDQRLFDQEAAFLIAIAAVAQADQRLDARVGRPGDLLGGEHGSGPLVQPSVRHTERTAPGRATGRRRA